MYLRVVRFQGDFHYVIRSSYKEGECWKSRDLVDLGKDPGRYLECAGGNGFYFNPGLEEALLAKGVKYCSEELENLFMPFLPVHIRRVIERFQSHRMPQQNPGILSSQELVEQQRNLHGFDKRRLHFLRCGRVDIGELDGRPWKFLQVLTEKSRDEIEQVIDGMEHVLRPREIRPYLFTALHLQARFPNHLLRNHPAALDEVAVDDYFLAALCSLNSDETYFTGVDRADRSTLHSYLEKYLVLYFDSEFAGDFWPERLKNHVRRQRPGPPTPGVRRMDLDGACGLLGITRVGLLSMDRKELVRLYRRRAKELHPDRGGDKEAFIRMREAFACVLEAKS